MQVIDRLRACTPMGQTFSAGVTEAAGRDPLDVMQAADSALYRAKERGRDRVIALARTDHEQTAGVRATRT